MRLELITRLPEKRRSATPLLFIHGACSSARLWDTLFLPFFARNGYAAYALSLRGHGRSEGRERLSTTRLRDYVEDVEYVISVLDAPPVLVGHSMGGMVAQHVLDRSALPGMVLMASGPPYGIVASSLRMAMTNPLLCWDMSLMSNFGPATMSLHGTRRAMFRKDTPDDYIRQVLPEGSAESMWAAWDMMGLDLPSSSPRPNVPVLVLGAEKDPFISPTAVELTAKAYDTVAEFFAGMPHAMMLDPEWELVARRILTWLDEVVCSGELSAAAS
jgi:pimeloyl-ACP methyl ester carboxylesterase